MFMFCINIFNLFENHNISNELIHMTLLLHRDILDFI